MNCEAHDERGRKKNVKVYHMFRCSLTWPPGTLQVNRMMRASFFSRNGVFSLEVVGFVLWRYGFHLSDTGCHGIYIAYSYHVPRCSCTALHVPLHKPELLM